MVYSSSIVPSNDIWSFEGIPENPSKPQESATTGNQNTLQSSRSFIRDQRIRHQNSRTKEEVETLSQSEDILVTGIGHPSVANPQVQSAPFKTGRLRLARAL